MFISFDLMSSWPRKTPCRHPVRTADSWSSVCRTRKGYVTVYCEDVVGSRDIPAFRHTARFFPRLASPLSSGGGGLISRGGRQVQALGPKAVTGNHYSLLARWSLQGAKHRQLDSLSPTPPPPSHGGTAHLLDAPGGTAAPRAASTGAGHPLPGADSTPGLAGGATPVPWPAVASVNWALASPRTEWFRICSIFLSHGVLYCTNVAVHYFFRLGILDFCQNCCRSFASWHAPATKSMSF